jgi:hypothetical protein
MIVQMSQQTVEVKTDSTSAGYCEVRAYLNRRPSAKNHRIAYANLNGRKMLQLLEK